MGDSWEEGLVVMTFALIFFAVIFAVAWAFCNIFSLELIANICSAMIATFLLSALGCYLGVVAIQKWEYSPTYYKLLSRIKSLRSSLKLRK